jgi:hypothetical protein
METNAKRNAESVVVVAYNSKVSEAPVRVAYYDWPHLDTIFLPPGFEDKMRLVEQGELLPTMQNLLLPEQIKTLIVNEKIRLGLIDPPF